METIKRTADSGAPAFTFTPHLTAGPVRAKVQQVGPALLNKFGTNARNQMLSRCVVRQRGNPLSAVKGEWITQFRTGLADPASFCLGLSRPTTPYVRNGFPSLMTGDNSDNSIASKRFAFMDYWVQWDAPPDAPAPVPLLPHRPLKPPLQQIKLLGLCQSIRSVSLSHREPSLFHTRLLTLSAGLGRLVRLT